MVMAMSRNGVGVIVGFSDISVVNSMPVSSVSRVSSSLKSSFDPLQIVKPSSMNLLYRRARSWNCLLPLSLRRPRIELHMMVLPLFPLPYQIFVSIVCR